MTTTATSATTIDVMDQGLMSLSFEDMMRYHGPGFPGGVAHAFKVMERALPLLVDGGPPERREIIVHTAFRGPGARDAFELATRAVTEGRYHVDPALERTERGSTIVRYVFRLSHRDRAVTVQIREGFVVDEFISLARRTDRTPDQERCLSVLKQDRLMAGPLPTYTTSTNDREAPTSRLGVAPACRPGARALSGQRWLARLVAQALTDGDGVLAGPVTVGSNDMWPSRPSRVGTADPARFDAETRLLARLTHATSCRCSTPASTTACPSSSCSMCLAPRWPHV